jgi:lipoprotein-releasing system ATP-binding protein
MTADDPLMRVESVSRIYADGGVVALRDVNLSIRAGECMAILGKSGSGKSSLMHILGGCDSPTAGAVYWRGQPVGAQDEWRRLRAARIGIIFQEFLLLPALTAIENVEMALMGKGHSTQHRRRRSTELLERVGLGARLSHRPSQLSGGERQRVAVVRALVNQPKLLLADEPTGALDRASALALGDLLVQLNSEVGISILLVTHALDLARRMGRVLELRDGILAPQEIPGAR